MYILFWQLRMYGDMTIGCLIMVIRRFLMGLEFIQ